MCHYMYDDLKMGTANSHGQITQQSWTPVLLGWWKPPKEQKTQERKIIKSCSLVMWRAGKKIMVHWLLCCGSGDGNSSWLCVQEKVLLVASCHSPYNCATLLVSDGIDVATAIAEWLHTLLPMTNESQITRKSEPSHAVISNKSLDFNTLPLATLSQLHWKKKKKVWKDNTTKLSVRSCATWFCLSYPVRYNVLF